MKYAITLAFAGFLFIPPIHAQQKKAIEKNSSGNEGPAEKKLDNKGFELNGQIAGLGNTRIILGYREGGKVVLDTSAVVNGVFAFKGKLVAPSFSQIWTVDKTFMQELYIENAKMRLSRRDSTGEATLTGSLAEEENKTFKASIRPLQQQMDSLNRVLIELGRTDTATAARRSQEEFPPLYDKFRSRIRAFIGDHPKALVSLYQLAGISESMNTSDLQSLYLKLSASLRESDLGKGIGGTIEARLKTEIGVTAMEFKQRSTKGEDISLASFRGKYVLIDFWASWCGPCRAENPNVVKSYSKYKGKGFEILGVSLDQDSTKWKTAIEKDGLAWTQVSDLKGWGNAVAGLYGVTGIPANFLLDPKGVIIAKNLRGEELAKKLSELFGNGE